MKPSAIGANHRQINVRICGGVAVSGKMFGGGQAAILADAANKLAYKLRDALRILPERSRVDDRIAGIVVYVRVRRIDPMNADGARFERSDLAHGVSVFQISACRKRHSGGKRS